MNHLDIREKFLSFFESQKHRIIESSSLVPSNDSTVLLTTAGMQQFKDYFLGEKDATKEIGALRATSIQKCFRTTDIDEVGDETHLTFFEMLGNFSFGDYFKEGAINFAWDLLTKIFKLDKNKLVVSVFSGKDNIPEDSEAIMFWKKHIDEKYIFKFGREANFWGPPGTTGPCGPSSEIHYDLTGKACERVKSCRANCPCGRYVEIWNLVFMQYFKDEAGNYKPLPKPSIDTGAGLERIAVILQNKSNIFETDLLNPLVKEISEKKQNMRDKDWKYVRILADHLRGSVFLISDGVRPSNLGTGYILRRIIRRAVRYAKELGLENAFYIHLINKIVDMFGPIYPDIRKNLNTIIDVWGAEEAKFRKTLEKGLNEFENLINVLKISGGNELGGEAVFHLYDTYGFPLEFSEELAKEAGVNIDRQAFEEEFKRHQMVSRAGIERKFGGHGLILTGELKASNEEEVKIVTRLHTATHLLHEALRRVLGNHVRQMGSDITPERLRFDFTHPQKLTKEEIEKVENIVNEQIAKKLKRSVEKMSFAKATDSGALAFFKEKYPETVSVYSFTDPRANSGQIFSREVCGGPHVENTSELGKFKIIKEESVAAGTRRVRAIVE